MEIRASLVEFILFIVPWIAAVGWLSSRVLGISLGRWRADRHRDLGMGSAASCARR